MYGFAIHERKHAVDPAWIKRFRGIPVANVSDMMSRMTAGGSRIRPMHDGTPMAGIALTVKTRPGDNLMLHKALTIAGPNDVIVVDGGGELTNSLFGEIMLQYAVHRGIAGLVLDGAIRDYTTLHAQSLPVFAAGITHRGPYKDGPGEINVPVAIDGMVIEPGDLVLGDGDGILCVPRDHVATIHEAASRKAEEEARALAAGEEGRFDKSWIDRELERRGCVVVS